MYLTDGIITFHHLYNQKQKQQTIQFIRKCLFIHILLAQLIILYSITYLFILSLLCYQTNHQIINFFFFILIIIEVSADIMPKKPTVPLFIFVLNTIQGRLVLARVGNKSPIICISSQAIIFLDQSIQLSFQRNSTGVSSSSAFLTSPSLEKLCLNLIAIEMASQIMPTNKMVQLTLLIILQYGFQQIINKIDILSKRQNKAIDIVPKRLKRVFDQSFLCTYDDRLIICGTQHMLWIRRNRRRLWKIFWYTLKQNFVFQMFLLRQWNHVMNIDKYWQPFNTLYLDTYTTSHTVPMFMQLIQYPFISNIFLFA